MEDVTALLYFQCILTNHIGIPQEFYQLLLSMDKYPSNLLVPFANNTIYYIIQPAQRIKLSIKQCI